MSDLNTDQQQYFWIEIWPKVDPDPQYTVQSFFFPIWLIICFGLLIKAAVFQK